MQLASLVGQINHHRKKQTAAGRRARRLIGRKKARQRFKFNHHLQAYFHHNISITVAEMAAVEWAHGPGSI